MDALELTSAVAAGNKRFQVQTKYSETSARVISIITYDSLLVLRQEKEVYNTTEDNIRDELASLQSEMVAEIELLYYISDKVKMINHPVSNNKLGVVFLKRNLYEDAINQFNIALEKDEKFIEAQNNLGLAYLLARDYESALKTFQEGIEKSGEYADLYNNLGYVNYELENYKEAIHAFKKSLSLNNDYAEAHFNLGQVYLKILAEELDDPDFEDVEALKKKATEHIMTAAELLPPRNIKFFDKINELIPQDEFDEIFKLVDIIKSNLSRRYELDFENEFYLKFMFGGKGKDDEFIRTYTEALQKTINEYPNYADLRNNLGIVYLIQCRNLFLKALDEFRQALKINSSFKKAEKNLKLAENDGKGFLILLRAILK